MAEIFFNSLYKNNPYENKEIDRDIRIDTSNGVEIKFTKSMYYNYKENNVDFTPPKKSENIKLIDINNGD